MSLRPASRAGKGSSLKQVVLGFALTVLAGAAYAYLTMRAGNAFDGFNSAALLLLAGFGLSIYKWRTQRQALATGILLALVPLLILLLAFVSILAS